MSAERKVFNSKRKYGSIPFDVETDDGIKSYFIIKMTCSQVNDWIECLRENSQKDSDGKVTWIPKSAKNMKETLLSLSVVDHEYKELPVSHFNAWTEETVAGVYEMADAHNFPTEKKD